MEHVPARVRGRRRLQQLRSAGTCDVVRRFRADDSVTRFAGNPVLAVRTAVLTLGGTDHTTHDEQTA